MRVLPLLALCVALCVALGPSAFAEAPAPATLALASVEARGNATAEEAAEVNDALTAKWVADGRLRVVERQQMAKVMKEQALSQSGIMSDEVQIKLAQLVGARWIAVGAIQSKGRSFVLSLRAIDSSTGQLATADTLKVGSADQLEAGSKQLARRLEDKLLGPGPAAGGQAANEVVGDFDVGQVKDFAKSLARSIALRIPKVVGRITDTLPDGTASCSFGAAQPFAGQFFEITGKDEVTEQEAKKGFFMLKAISPTGCSGKVKREGGAAVVTGDALESVPVKINVESLEPGAGAQPELAQLLADETRNGLGQAPQFNVAKDPQLTAMGRVSGPRGHRTVELQVVDRKGNVVQKVELPGTF